MLIEKLQVGFTANNMDVSFSQIYKVSTKKTFLIPPQNYAEKLILIYSIYQLLKHNIK